MCQLRQLGDEAVAGAAKHARFARSIRLWSHHQRWLLGSEELRLSSSSSSSSSSPQY